MTSLLAAGLVATEGGRERGRRVEKDKWKRAREAKQLCKASDHLEGGEGG